jgi:hypothetical protein
VTRWPLLLQPPPGDDAYEGDYLLLCQSDGAQTTSARLFVEDQKRFDAFWGPKAFRS